MKRGGGVQRNVTSCNHINIRNCQIGVLCGKMAGVFNHSAIGIIKILFNTSHLIYANVDIS